jgi:hypothetical protein
MRTKRATASARALSSTNTVRSTRTTAEEDDNSASGSVGLERGAEQPTPAQSKNMAKKDERIFDWRVA